MTELIQTETRKRIARIDQDRPEGKDALTGEMYPGLADAADSAQRAILIHGRADYFGAGNYWIWPVITCNAPHVSAPH